MTTELHVIALMKLASPFSDDHTTQLQLNYMLLPWWSQQAVIPFSDVHTTQFHILHITW